MYKVFMLPAYGYEASEQHLNQFLAQHKIVQVDRQFVSQGGAGLLESVCLLLQLLRRGLFEKQLRGLKNPIKWWG